ncbi:MAG: 5'-nucleotidase, partial [Cruoricaptor ignavus]|nr:5'-nucleotidase [Cruoricaptor ignavus]
LVLSEETSQYKTQVDYYKNAVIIAGCGNMGQLTDVSFSHGKKINVAVHPIDETIKENEELKQYANQQTENAEKTLKKIVGNVGSFHKDCDPTGNIVTDAYRWYYKTEVAIINGGGLRSKLPENEITLRDIFAVLPFENEVIPVKITGEELQRMIEEISTRIPPQVSGMSYEITNAKPKTIGQIKINGKPIKQEQLYTVAVPDFVILGGNGITPTSKEKWISTKMPYEIDSEILQQYLQYHKNITAPVCDRITLIEK